MSRASHIEGPSLCGFHGLFESDYGDSSTPEPLCTITPSFVGNSMLPFRCPRCEKIMQALACPKTRDMFRDKRPGHGNYFCPDCGYRFKLNEEGTPLTSSLPAGALCGPSRVDCVGGSSTWQDNPGFIEAAIDVALETVLGAVVRRRRHIVSIVNPYALLASGVTIGRRLR